MPFKEKHAKVTAEYKSIEKEIMEKAAEKERIEKRKIYIEIINDIMDYHNQHNFEDGIPSKILDDLIKKYELKSK